eukprot:scaffold132516_cov36-Tisochrysis_lutea.AAC.1
MAVTRDNALQSLGSRDARIRELQDTVNELNLQLHRQAKALAIGQQISREAVRSSEIHDSEREFMIRAHSTELDNLVQAHNSEREALIQAHETEKSALYAELDELKRAHQEEMLRVVEELEAAHEACTAVREEADEQAGKRRLVEGALARAQQKEHSRIHNDREVAMSAARERLRDAVHATRPVLRREPGMWVDASPGRRVRVKPHFAGDASFTRQQLSEFARRREVGDAKGGTAVETDGLRTVGLRPSGGLAAQLAGPSGAMVGWQRASRYEDEHVHSLAPVVAAALCSPVSCVMCHMANVVVSIVVVVAVASLRWYVTCGVCDGCGCGENMNRDVLSVRGRW